MPQQEKPKSVTGCSAASGGRCDLPPVGWGSHKFYILWNLQNYNIQVIIFHFLYKSCFCNLRTHPHLHLCCVVVEVSRCPICPIKPETNVQTPGVMSGYLQWRGVDYVANSPGRLQRGNRRPGTFCPVNPAVGVTLPLARV